MYRCNKSHSNIESKREDIEHYNENMTFEEKVKYVEIMKTSIDGRYSDMSQLTYRALKEGIQTRALGTEHIILLRRILSLLLHASRQGQFV